MRRVIMLALSLYVTSAYSGWNYRVEDDKFTGEKSYFASVHSDNSFDLPFPYTGGTRSTVIIRKGSKSQYGNGVRDVISIEVSNGQLFCPLHGCSVRVKFDSRVFNSPVHAPQDGTHTTLGIFEVASFVSKLKKSQKMSIELEFYKEGKRIFEYDTSGLVWTHH